MDQTRFSVTRSNLIAAIKKNREKHQKIVEEAQKKYRELVIKKLDEMLAIARKGGKIIQSVNLPMPISRLKEYDNIIELLEMTDTPSVEITEEEFAKYVKDQWSWSMTFNSTNKIYTNMVESSEEEEDY